MGTFFFFVKILESFSIHPLGTSGFGTIQGMVEIFSPEVKGCWSLDEKERGVYGGQ